METIDYNLFPFTGLDGTIERLLDGTKTNPIYPAGYLTNPPNNLLDKPIRYIRCGKDQAQTFINSDGIEEPQRDIFILDCDSSSWSDIIEAVSLENGIPSYICKVESDVPGRFHYYYNWVETLPAGKHVLGFNKKLELFNGSSGVFGVSSGNKTKTIAYLAPKDLVDIEPTENLIVLLNSLCKPEIISKASDLTLTSKRLFYTLLDSEEFARMMANPKELQPKFKTFLKMVTPKRYAELADYEGVVHPDSIPEGEGNNYLRDVRLALFQAQDTSPELTYETLVLIGCYLWSKPLKPEDIQEQIHTESAPDCYIKGSENFTTGIITKYGRQAFIFKVLREGEYWIVELPLPDNLTHIPPIIKIPLRHWATESRKWLAQETFIDPHYGGNDNMKKNTLKRQQENIVKSKHKELLLVKDRTKAGGLNQDHTVFNEYPSSEFLGWMNGYIPLELKDTKPPLYTLNFLKNLAPNEEEFLYLLRFLKTFLNTNWKTSVILYFLGAGGTGKTSFIKFLTYLVGGASETLNPSLKEYLADKNGIIFTKTLIIHEEYSKQGNRADFSRVDGIDKSFTGNEIVTIRQLYKDSYNITANGLILKTDNLNSVNISLDNRRVFSFNPKKKLKDCSWSSGNPVEHLIREAPNFANYLLQEIDILTSEEFNDIPFESKYTREIQMEEYSDDYLMQLLMLLAYKDMARFKDFVRAKNELYMITLSGKNDKGITISTLVTFIRTFEPNFAIANLSYYCRQLKDVLPLVDCSTAKDVPGMPSRRDRRIVLPESDIRLLEDILA